MTRSTLVKLGLASDFVGAVMVSFSGYFGLAAGFGGPIVWENKLWRGLWWFGWAFFAMGLFLQWVALRASDGPKPLERERHSRTSRLDTASAKVVLLIFILLLLIFSGISVLNYINGKGLMELLVE